MKSKCNFFSTLLFLCFFFAFKPAWCQERKITDNLVFQAKPVVTSDFFKSDNSKLLSPDDYDGILGRGFQKLSDGLVNEAEKDFESVIYGAPEYGGGYYGIGLCSKFRGDTVKALEKFREAVLKDAFFGPAHLELGDLQFSSNPEDAEKSYLMARKLMPESVEPVYRLGLMDLHHNSLSKAKRKFKKGLRMDPRHFGLNYMLGRIRFMENMHKSAVKYFSKCIAENQQDVDVITWRAVCYTVLGKYSAAIKDLDNSILIQPDNSFLYTIRGALNYQKRKYLEAVNDFSRTFMLAPPANSDFRVGEGLYPQTEEFKFLLNLVQESSHFKDSKMQADMAKVVSSLLIKKNQTALNTLKPYLKTGESIPIYFHGVILEKKRKKREALENYKVIEKSSPVFTDAQKRIGHITFEELEDMDLAYSIFHQLTMEDSTYVLGFKFKGNILTKKGDYQQAISEYNRAIKIDSTGSDLFFNRAACFMALNKNQESLSDLERVVNLKPRDAESWANMGFIQLAMGDTTAAKESFSISLENKYNPKVYFNRALILMHEKDYAGAIEDFKKLDIYTDYYDAALLNISSCFYFLKEYQKSIDGLNVVIGRNSKEAKAYYLRGLCYLKQENPAQAESDIRTAKQLGLEKVE